MKLTAYIEAIGTRRLAREIEVDASQVNRWKHLREVPNVKHSRKIVRHSKGKVSYPEIFEPFFKNQKI